MQKLSYGPVWHHCGSCNGRGWIEIDNARCPLCEGYGLLYPDNTPYGKPKVSDESKSSGKIIKLEVGPTTWIFKSEDIFTFTKRIIDATANVRIILHSVGDDFAYDADGLSIIEANKIEATIENAMRRNEIKS